MERKYTTHENEAQALPLTRRLVKPLITEQNGAQNAVMYSGVYEAGKRMPAHRHERVEEMIYILSGQGEVSINGKAEPICPGTSIYLPPGSLHFLNVMGDQPLRLIFVFSPPEVPGRTPEALA